MASCYLAGGNKPPSYGEKTELWILIYNSFEILARSVLSVLNGPLLITAGLSSSRRVSRTLSPISWGNNKKKGSIIRRDHYE